MRGRITEARGGQQCGFVGQLTSSNGKWEDLSLATGVWMIPFTAKSSGGAEPNESLTFTEEIWAKIATMMLRCLQHVAMWASRAGLIALSVCLYNYRNVLKCSWCWAEYIQKYLCAAFTVLTQQGHYLLLLSAVGVCAGNGLFRGTRVTHWSSNWTWCQGGNARASV